QAALGLYTPPYVATSITRERENIERIKGILRGWGETVDERPDDVEPPTVTAEQSRVTRNFGTQNTSNAGTVININGGDFRGSNLPIGNTIGRDLNQTIQSDVYNIAGDLNMSANPSKDEFLTALRQLKDELAKAKDLPADEASDLKGNLDDA